MAILASGETFATSEQVTATRLNNAINSATAASGLVDGSTTALSGGAVIVKDLGVTTGKLATGAVTLPKMADMAQDSFIGRDTASTGAPEVIAFGTGVKAFIKSPTSANLATAVTGETGSGALVFGTSPTLVTPALGTPSALVGTNISGTAASLVAGNSSQTYALASVSTTVNVSSATAPSSGQVLTATSSTAATWQTPSSGSGDVTASSNMTDNTMLKGDGGAKGIQDTGISIDDSNNVSSMGTLGCGAVTSTGSVTGTSFKIGANTLLSGLGAAIADAVTSHSANDTDLSSLAADVDSFCDALGTKINTVIARMEAGTPTIST